MAYARTVPHPDLRLGLEQVYGPTLPRWTIEKLKGDASTRSYFRVTTEGGSPRSLIVMQLPEDAFGSDEGGTQPATTRLPFLEIGELLAERAIPVPAVHAERLESGQIFLEDLGDTTFAEKLYQTPQSEWPTWYGRAVDLLVELHEACAVVLESSIVAQREYDLPLLRWELDHFREWGLEALFGSLGPDESAALERDFEAIATEMASMPSGFVHRDFQSKNLMVGPDDALTVIDFQDAMRGPRVYDLVALLCDSYLSIDPTLQKSMIQRYAAARRIETQTLEKEFWTVAIHRKLKDAGRFVFIDRVRGNPGFLEWFPQSLVYVGRALTHTNGFSSLQGLLETKIPGFPNAVDQPDACSE